MDAMSSENRWGQLRSTDLFHKQWDWIGDDATAVFYRFSTTRDAERAPRFSFTYIHRNHGSINMQTTDYAFKCMIASIVPCNDCFASIFYKKVFSTNRLGTVEFLASFQPRH
jgi:hypothetical protein